MERHAVRHKQARRNRFSRHIQRPSHLRQRRHQRRQGLELSAEYGLGNVTLSSTYTYLRARYGSGTASIPAANRLPGIPEQQLFAQVGWSPDLATSIGGVFTLEARHTGRVFADDAKSAQTKAYTRLGLAARFDTDCASRSACTLEIRAAGQIFAAVTKCSWPDKSMMSSLLFSQVARSSSLARGENQPVTA